MCFIKVVLDEKMLKDTFSISPKAVTNHSKNGNTPVTNRSINGKIQPGCIRHAADGEEEHR